MCKHSEAPIILVGTKADLKDDPEEMARLESVGEEVVSEEQVTIVNKDWESKDLYSVPGGEDHKGTE